VSSRPSLRIAAWTAALFAGKTTPFTALSMSFIAAPRDNGGGMKSGDKLAVEIWTTKRMKNISMILARTQMHATNKITLLFTIYSRLI
jgi:hypothetical protein